MINYEQFICLEHQMACILGANNNYAFDFLVYIGILTFSTNA